MITDFKTSTYKTGVNNGTPQWDITFTETDFQTMTGSALLEGPFSLVVDMNATGSVFPILFGIELQSVGGSVNITDSSQIAFVPRNERKIVTSGSVPQLAYITGIIKKIIIHCFGFIAADAAKCKVSIRVGPNAVLTAPLSALGRATMVNDPGTIFYEHHSASIPASSVNYTLFQLDVPNSGLRYLFKSINLIVPPTPSYTGDIEGVLAIIDRYGSIQADIATIRSKQYEYTSFIYPFEFILDVECTLQYTLENTNTGTAYTVETDIYWELIY